MRTRFVVTALGALALCALPALAASAGTGSLADNIPRFLGRLHPVVVHFPIALLIAAALFEIGALIFKKDRSRPAGPALACVVLGALGAGAAAWFGWINADLEPHGSGVADLIGVHRWLGISAAGLAGVAMIGAIIGATGKAKGMTMLYRVALLLAAGLVATSGHWGGSIVYGEGYLTEALFPKPAPAPVPVTEEELDDMLAELDLVASDLTVDFATDIAPVFARACVKCHGPTKKKGNLRLDARSFVFDERDADEQVIIPGNADASDLFLRVALPAHDDDVMPPEDEEERLSAEEIGLIETWINEGAVWVDVPIVKSAQNTGEAAPAPAVAAPALPELVFDDAARAARDSAIERVRERGGVAMLVAQNEPWVEVRLDLVSGEVTDADIAVLDGLEPTLIGLNLAGTEITDSALFELSGFRRLERLHLERTAVTDTGVALLAEHPSLRYLNLYGTSVTDLALVTASTMPNLRALYLWQTQVNPAAGSLLAKLRPGLVVDVATALVPATFDDAPVTETADEPAAEPEAQPAGEGGVVIDVALLPGCCKAAAEAGGECDHACCVEARAKGEICPQCSSN